MSPPTLLTLPRELRLQIYEDLYPPLPSKKPIPLLPLSHALVLTSRLTYVECLPIYSSCYDNYYSASRFDLTLDEESVSSPEVERQILATTEKDFARITNLTITVHSHSQVPSGDWIYGLIHPYGGWRVTRPPGPPDRFIPGIALPEEGGRMLTWRRFRPWITRVSPESDEVIVVPTKAAWDYHAGEVKLIKVCRRIGGQYGGGGLRGHVLALLKTGMIDD